MALVKQSQSFDLNPIAPVPDQSQRRQASTSCAIDTSRMKQQQKTAARAKTRKRCNIESVLCGVVPIICNTPQQATLIRTCHRRLREKKSHNRFPPDPCHHKKLLIPSATGQNNPHIPPAEMEYGTAFSIFFLIFFFRVGFTPPKVAVGFRGVFAGSPGRAREPSLLRHGLSWCFGGKRGKAGAEPLISDTGSHRAHCHPPN